MEGARGWERIQADNLTGTWLSGWRHPHETTMTLSVDSDNLGDALQEEIIARTEHEAF